MTAINRTAASAATVKPSAPTIEIRSPFAGRSFMTDITVNGDAGFVVAGQLEVWRGAIKIFELRPADGERNPQSIKVQTAGQEWDWNDPLRVYLWSADGSEARIRLYLAADLNPIQATSTVTEADPITTNILTGGGPLDPNTAVLFCIRLAAMAGQFNFSDPRRAALQAVGVDGFDLVTQREKAQALEDAGLPALADEMRALNETPVFPDRDDRNTLFPRRIYSYEEHARLIDMRGNRNAIFTIAPTLLRQPTVALDDLTGEVRPHVFQGALEANAIDLNPTSVRVALNDAPRKGGAKVRIAGSAVASLSMPASGSVDIDGQRWRWTRDSSPLMSVDVDVASAEGGRGMPMRVTQREARVSGATFARSWQLENDTEPGQRWVRCVPGIHLGLSGSGPTTPTGDPLPSTIPFTVTNRRFTAYDRRSFGGGVTLSIESKALDGSWSPTLEKFATSFGDGGTRSLGVDVGGALLPSGRAILRARLIAGHQSRGEVYNDPTFDGLRGLEAAAGVQRVP